MRTFFCPCNFGQQQTALGQYEGSGWHTQAPSSMRHVEAQRGALRGQVENPSKLSVRKNRGSLASLLPPPHERWGNDRRTNLVAPRQRRRLKRFLHDDQS